MKVQFNNIPEQIRGEPLYCLAKIEQKPGKEKPDKIPFLYSWRLEQTDKLPSDKKPCKALREMEKQVNSDL